MEYRNVKTGAVITTHGEVHGDDWEPEKKKRSRKNADEKKAKETEKNE